MDQENPLIALDGLPLSERRKLTNTILTAYQRLTSDSGESIDFSPDADVKELLSGDTEPNQRFDAKALQNRDRSRDSYVLQMQKIAANPDYDRLSTSKSPSFGAPMVFSRGVTIPTKQAGRKEVITMSDGKGGAVKIPAVYAVVEADSLLASHDANGNKVEGYGGEQGLMALNNGRTAALKLAYKKSTADGYNAAMYQEALKQDADSHGVDASVIESMKEPVLVRVFAESALQGIDDPGAASNEKIGAELSDSERAKTDAGKLTSSVLMLHSGGDLNNLANRDFVKAYMQAMGGSDAVGDMQTADGGLSASGVRRIEAALVARAYGDDATLNDLTESPDSELKSLGDTLKQVAGKWSVMKEASQGGLIASSMDITPQLNEAIALIRKSRREGSSIAELVGQNNLFTGQLNPVTEALLRMFYRGDYMGRIRSAEKIRAALNGYLDKAMQSTAGADMLGYEANPIAEIDQQKKLLESDELAAKSQRSMFDSAEFFNDCADGFCMEEVALDSVAELSLLERRKLTKEVLAGIEQLQSGELKLLERRKITNQVLEGIGRLGGNDHTKETSLDEPNPPVKNNNDLAYSTLFDRAKTAVRTSAIAMQEIKVNAKDIMQQTTRTDFYGAVNDVLLNAVEEPALKDEVISIFNSKDSFKMLLGAIYDTLEPEARQRESLPNPEPVKTEDEPSPKTIDDLVAEAVANGIELSSNDVITIKSLHQEAEDIYKKAYGNSDGFFNSLSTHFHLGTVGGSGRNVRSLNARRESSIERSIDQAKKNVALHGQAKAKVALLESMLKGVGTEADIALKAEKKEKHKLAVARKSLTLAVGSKFAGMTITKVTLDTAGYVSKICWDDPLTVDPVSDYWRFAFSSKAEFITYVDQVKAESLEQAQAEEKQQGSVSEAALVTPLDGTDTRAEVEQALADIEAGKADKEAQKEREGIVRLNLPTVHTIDFQKEMRKAIINNNGLVAVDDVKEAFEQLVRNKEAVLEQLKKHKKDELIRFSGSYYPNENKDFQVKQAYNAFVSSFAYFTVDSITYSYGQDYERDVIKPYVDKLTQEDLIKWAGDIHKARAEYEAKKAALRKALDNPETLEEYEQFIKRQGKDKLSPAQLAQYDQLKANTIIAQQKTEVEQKQEQQSVVKNEHGAIAYSLAQTTHAKKGITLYVVRLTGDRLEKKTFYDLSAKAKKLGGYYSSYRGQGAIPGFQFESEADRTSFTKLLDGESVDITDKIEEQQTEKEESRVDKLLALAEKMEADAKEILDQDRKTNTARRASIASSIEERARGNIAFAKTLRRIAEGVREGNVQYLAGMSQATQLEALYSSLSSARSKYVYSGQFKKLTYNNRKNLEESLSSGSASQDHMDAMLANVTLPKPSLWRNDMRRIAEKMKGKKGYAKTAQQLERLSWSADENKIHPVPLEIAQKVLEFREANKTGPNAVYEGWQVDGDVANLKRFSRMGIDTDEHLRMALRELLSLKESREKADPLNQMERNLIGKYKDIEWFNTPDTAAMRVARLAHIHPNHKVLEPSAGFGHLADAVASLGVPKANIHCVELSNDLSAALELKGYQVVHNGSFLSYSKGGYDRVIMNPPFSKNQDIMHVMHAFKLLKAGGRLVAIMSSMAGDRDDKKNKAFKNFLDLHAVDGEKLPEGTFLKSINSTGVSTKIVVLEKNANLSTQDRVDAEGETASSWFVLDSVDNLPAASVEMMDSTEFSTSLTALKSEVNGDIRAYYFEAKRYGLPDEKTHQILLSGELPESIKLEIDGLRMRAESIADDPDKEEGANSDKESDNSLIDSSINPDFIPTHTLEDGTEVESHPEDATSFVDAFGNEYQDETAIAIPDAGNPKPMPPANEPLPTIEYLDAPSGGKDFGRINEQALGIGGLLDIPIRIEKSAWNGGLSQKLDRAANISKCGIGGGGIAHVKFVTLFHKEIYKKGNVFLLVATSSYRDTQIGTAVLSIKESDYGGCYEVIRGIGALSGTESEINAEKALRGSELVWKQGAASVEKSETDLPFITFSKPFSPQKLFEKTSIWNSRGRVEDYYAKLTNVEVAALWAWVKFVNFLVRYPSYRYYSWDTSKTFHGGLNGALKQTGGEDHLNEIKEHLEQRGLYEDADSNFMIDVNAIQKWIDGKNKSALAASNPSDEDAPEESDKPNAEAIPDEVTIQLSSGMNDSLDQTSENYRFADTGYIAGSKKELAAQRIKMARANGDLVRVKDIDWVEIEENPRSANALITKSNILGKPDWKALRESGMTPQAAFLIDKIYRSIAQKPEPDTPEARKAYVMGLETLRDRLEKLKTPEEVSNLLFNELRIELTGIKFTAEEESEYKRLDELSKQARHERMLEVQKGGNRNNALVAELTQKAGDLEKARMAIYTQANERQANSPEFKAWSSFGEKFKGVLKHRYSNTGSKAFAEHYWNAKNGRPDNWDWAISEKAEAETGSQDEGTQDKKSKKSKFALVVSPSFERLGGRSISAESTLALKNAFNLREVQSGNYVLKDKASAEFHVSRCAEAFADLADILGIQDSRISLGGRLAMAFGARGSGNALAHYEPVERVINMTKMSGGGSLAHEWFHAFDNLLVEYMGESAGKVGNYLSDNPSLTLKPVVKSAFENLRSAMMSGAEREKITVEFTESDRAFAKRSFDGRNAPMYVSLRTAKTLQEAIDWLERQNYRYKRGDLEKWLKLICAYHSEEGETTANFLMGKGASKFYRDAQELDKGRSKPYWSTMLEMAARAFSAYIEDKLSEKGCKNDYLSNGSSNDVADYVSAGARPFPEGSERTVINAAFDKLFESLRENQILDSIYEAMNEDCLEPVPDYDFKRTWSIARC